MVSSNLFRFDSPGFVKDDFVRFFFDHAVKIGDTPVLRQRSKFVCAHASSGHRKSIDEMLGNPDLQSQLVAVKAADQVCTTGESACALYIFEHCLSSIRVHT